MPNELDLSRALSLSFFFSLARCVCVRACVCVCVCWSLSPNCQVVLTAAHPMARRLLRLLARQDQWLSSQTPYHMPLAQTRQGQPGLVWVAATRRGILASCSTLADAVLGQAVLVYALVWQCGCALGNSVFYTYPQIRSKCL